MPKIVGMAGSLRKGSLNAALLRAAAELAPTELRIEIESIRGIPIYDGDLEAESGIPEPVARIKDAIAAADGLLLVTPEYNASIPGPLKNALDWLTRPPRDLGRVFGGRKVGVIGASPGGFGTMLAQTAWLPIFRYLGVVPFFGRSVYLSRAGKAFEDGKLVDDDARERLARYLAELAGFLSPR
jgi:chromate reductase, NAD(P)H dehydrogenase (quinone)